VVAPPRPVAKICGLAVLLVLLLSFIALKLSGCHSSVTLPGVDPDTPVVAEVMYRFPENALFAYGSYRFEWIGAWVTDNMEVSDASLLTQAAQTMVLTKNDVYPSYVALFPVEGPLRGGYWQIVLTVFGLPGQDQMGQWQCILPGNSLPYLPPGQPTLVTFQGNPDGSASCTTEPGSFVPI
jgi:hypothetical protein